MTKEQEALILDNLGLAFSVAKQFQNTGLELDDLVGCARLGLVKAAVSFCPDRGYAFSSLAWKICTVEILTVLRRERKIPRCQVYLDAPIKMDDSELYREIPDPMDYVSQIESRLELNGIMSGMSEIQRSVLCAYYGIGQDPAGQVELAKRYGVSQSYVSRLIRKGLSYMKRKMD